MLNLILRNIGRFAFLVLLQVLVLNDIHLFQVFNPYLYILFILLLPFETPNWLLMLLCAALGLTVDAFSNTLGMHLSACIFIGFARPSVLRVIAPREGYEFGMRPHVQVMGLAWTALYALMMVFLHHFWLYLVEAFRFSALPQVLLKTAVSGLFTMVLILITQYLTFKSKPAL